MNNIDFLPERYHERDLKRRAKIWQYALLMGFGALLLGATLGQIAIKRSLQASLTELRQSRTDTNLKRERVTLLKQQLGRSEQVAALYTYLRHPWPRTQLLAQITDPLPDSIVLQGVEILEEAPNGPSFGGNETFVATGEASPAAADLIQLREVRDSTRLVLRIRGTVEETAALNEYVRRLGDVPLFRGVAISSLQSQASQDQASQDQASQDQASQDRASQDQSSHSAFELSVIIRPGHGQSGGPNGPLLKRDPAVQLSMARRSK